MSGEVGPLNMPMTILFAAIFAILGIILLVTIVFSGIKPYEQIARANAEKLASAIDEVCFMGSGHTVEIGDFYLPQNSPILSDMSAFGPTLRIRNDGDPKFVLYYEMFPPGEAVGWEVYLDPGYRAIAMWPGDLDVESAPDFINSVKNFVYDQYKDDDVPPESVDVIIGNIMLTGDFNPLSGEDVPTYGLGLGTWEDEEVKSTPTKFTLNSNVFSSAVNKTAPKYLSCGENALCLKAGQNIFVYPLKHCAGKIDYIKLFNSDGDFNFKYSDFYLASPCKADITVSIQNDCSSDKLNIDIHGFLPWDSDPIYTDSGGCKNYIEYPIFSFSSSEDGNSLDKLIAETHKTCLDSVSDIDTPSFNKPCIMVSISKTGFCYTKNPPSDTTTDITISAIIEAVIPGPDKPTGIYKYPVEKFTDYIYHDIMGYGTHIFVLKSTKSPSTFDFWTYAKDKIGYQAIWRWPS